MISLRQPLFALALALFVAGSAQAQAPSAGKAALDADARCTRCHDETEAKPVLSIYQTRHGVKADPNAPSCQSCHGDSEAHIRGEAGSGSGSRPATDTPIARKGRLTPAQASEVAGRCLACHDGAARTHWDGSQHASQGLTCTNCHSLHAAHDPVLTRATQPEVCYACHKAERAQVHRLSAHPIEAGKLGCSDCHNPHGTIGPKLLARGTINETCLTCHAERRGPVLWEHEPVTEDCTNCHTPHGSANPSLLKVRVPFLCQQCHSGDHANGVNSGANLPDGAVTSVNGLLANGARSPRAQTNGRACLACHSMVHGSNHPAGAKFLR